MDGNCLYIPRVPFALLAITIYPVAGLCQTPPGSSDELSYDKGLPEVVVTGSLIPQTKITTATPVIVITAEDLQARGFSTVADALQQMSVATGSVEGPQNPAFTPAAQTLSMFGLDPSYVKYLIDGRPMSAYPALYGGSDQIVSLTGIPTELVDHIDILPGGQSSLYGSDAIAGVVNIVLKKFLDKPIADVRYGFYQDGGGVDKRFAFADSFQMGRATLLAGVQYEKTDPIWGYQRPLTASYYGAGTTPATAEQDYLVFGQYTNPNGTYYFLDPNNCSAVASLFDGSERPQARPGLGSYCGTTKSGYNTIDNGNESSQGYLHGTVDLFDHLQFYSDVLVNHEVTEFNTGPGYWSSSIQYPYFYDPHLADLVFLQRLFSPEEAGGLRNVTSQVITNSDRITLGARGYLGSSNWTYDTEVTHTKERVEKITFVLRADAIDNFFAPVLGPQLGLDPIYSYYPVFSPNYAAFYKPVTPAQFATFSGFGTSHSNTSDDLWRTQFTNSSLFSLPGGPAGIAAVVEGGYEDWSYRPDVGFTDGEYYEYEAVTGGGHRSRYAATTELRLPVLSTVTLTTSGRYDLYSVAGNDIDKPTYNLSLEFRPIEAMLVRGRYGTAFKTPTLADEFQGQSGYGISVTDYYQCGLLGYKGTTLGNCPYYLAEVLGTTSGNPKLKPITANVWDIGLVWSPVDHLSITADYIHWAIDNETDVQSADQLLQVEALCRTGVYPLSSPTCQAALSQVTRNQFGQIVSINTPKINISQEGVNAITSAVGYSHSIGTLGILSGQSSWSALLKHVYQEYPTDPIIDELRDPTYSTDFKTKANASLTWSKNAWSSTVYVAWYGRSPNYLATVYGYGTPDAGTLSPWTIYNLTARYQLTPALAITLAADNLFNAMPPADHTYPGTTSSPYNSFNYNVYGRSYMIDAKYKFGH